MKIECPESNALYNQYYENGNQSYRQGNYAEAQRWYDEALKINPLGIDVLKALAMVLGTMNQFQPCVDFHSRHINHNN